MKRVFYIICGKCKKFKTLKKYTFLKKNLLLSIIAVSVVMKMKKYLKKKNRLRY